MKHKSDYVLIIILLFLSLFSIRKLITSDIIIYWDWMGMGPYFREELYNSLYIWSFDQLGRISMPIESWITPYLFALVFGYKITNNVWILLPIPLSGMFMYLLARKVIGEPVPSFVAALIYMFNPMILDRFLQAHIGVLYGYALMPIFFYMALLAFHTDCPLTKRAKYIMISGVILAFTSGLQPQFLYLLVLLLTLYVFTDFFIYRDFRKLTINFMIISFISSFSLLLLLPSVLQVLYFSGFQFAASQVDVSFLDVLSGQNHILNIIRLVEHPGPGFYQQLGYWKITYWTLLGLVAPALAFGSVIFHKKIHEEIVIKFLVIGLISLILSTGTTYIKGVYTFLYLNIPFFYAFRESTKFLVILSLTYSILVGISISFITSYNFSSRVNRLKSRFRIVKTFSYPDDSLNKMIGMAIVLIVVTAHLISSLPMLTGDWSLYKIHPNYEISESYYELGTWISSQDEFFRIAIVPYDNYVLHTWHVVSNKPLLSLNYGSWGGMPYNSYQYTIYTFDSLIDGSTSNLGSLLGITSTKYVILRDGVFKEPNPRAYTNDRYKTNSSKLKKILDSQKDLEIVKKFEGFTVYENLRYKEHISIAKKPLLAVGDRQLFKSLIYLPAFDLSSNALIFANQQNNLLELSKHFDTVVLNDESISLIFSLLNNTQKFFAYDFANQNGEINEAWLRSDALEFWEGGLFGRGAMPHGGGYAITRGDGELTLGFNSLIDSEQGLWLRILKAPNRGNITISIDDKKIAELSPQTHNFVGFRWLKVASLNIEKGKHTIKMTNSNGENVLDQIVIAPKSIMNLLYSQTRDLLNNKTRIYIYESDRLFHETTMTQYDSASSDYATILNGKTSAYIEIPINGNYTFFVRALGDQTYLNVSISDLSASFKLDNSFKWYKTNHAYLEEGKYKLALQGKNTTVDLIGYYNGNAVADLENFFSTMKQVEYDYVQVNPTRYEISYTSNGSFLLILAESYNPLWKAYNSTSELTPIMANSYANGFYINVPLDGKIVVEFTEQKTFEEAFLISIIALIGILIITMYLNFK